MPLTAAQLETLAQEPASGTNDAGTITQRSADDLLKLLDRAAGVDAMSGASGYGGPKSAFRMLRPARAGMPGASGRSSRLGGQ